MSFVQLTIFKMPALGLYIEFTLYIRTVYIRTVQNTSAQTKLYNLYSGSVSVDFSPDGKYIATGNDNGDATLWELANWWTDDVNTIDFKPGGNV